MGRIRQFDEARVLESARNQFWETGYAGTSMDAVATATGLGKGSLYGAFGDKRTLFGRVFESYCTGIVATTRRKLQGPDDGAWKRLRAQMRGVAAGTAADEDHRGCLLAKGTAELAEHDPEILARGRDTVTALRDALTDVVAAAQRHGDIEATVEPVALAGVLLAVQRGIEALGKAGADPATLRSIADTTLALIPSRTPGA